MLLCLQHWCCSAHNNVVTQVWLMPVVLPILPMFQKRSGCPCAYISDVVVTECCGCAGLTADEEMARRLQAEYDREVASHVLDQPDDAAMRRMAGSAFHTSPQGTPSTAHSSQSAASPASQPGRPPSGVAPVRYPSLGNSGTQQGLCIGFDAHLHSWHVGFMLS